MKMFSTSEYSKIVSDEWRLLSEHAASFNQTHEWVSAIPNYFSAELNLQWICMEDGVGAAAALLLASQNVKRYRVLPFKVLKSLNPRGILHADTIVRPGADLNEVLNKLCESRIDGGRKWDALEFRSLRAKSPLLRLSSLLPNSVIKQSMENGVSVIDTSGKWCEWQAKLSAGFLTDLRKKRTRLEKLGQVRFRMFTHSADEAMEGLAQFIELESSGWKCDSGALVNDSSDFGVVLSAVERLAPSGNAGVFGIYLDSRMVAGYVWVKADSTLYGLKTAYSEDFSRMSPGKLLTAELIKYCFEQNDIRELDFCARVDWSSKFGVSIEPTYSVYAYNPRTLLGRVGLLKARIADFFARLRGAFLDNELVERDGLVLSAQRNQ